MNRTTAFSLIALAVVTGMRPEMALAADEEVQFWLTGTAVVPVVEDASGTFEVSRRFREGDDQLLLRGNVDFRLSEAVSLGGGVAFVNSIDGLFETGDDKERRLQQQMTLTFGALSLRTRVEQRFFEEADRMQLRIRQRIQASFPVTEAFGGAVSGEVFYIARSEDDQGDDQIAQWRLNATLTHKLAKHVDATLGYLLMYTPAQGGPDQIAHVPQLTLTYRP